jgi:DNA-binding MarR family transcriptional regulator
MTDDVATSDRERLRLENIFGAMSLALVDKMETAFSAETGLNPSAVAAIIQIGTDPGLSIEALRRIIALSHSATVRLIDQLVAGGLVVRGSGSDNDRRARALHLTDAGQAVFQRNIVVRRAVIERAVRNLTAEEKRSLDGLVDKLLTALVDPGDDHDIVCRVCDVSVCTPDRCPITHMVDAE